MPTRVLLATAAIALAIALPAAAADQPDPCKDPKQLENAEFARECQYLAEAEAINAELNATTAALRKVMATANELVDRIDALTNGSPQ